MCRKIMKSISEQEKRILDVLIFEGKIPTSPFEITETHLIDYMHAYVNVLNKTPCNLHSKDYRYSRKMAALSIMKYLVSIGGNINCQPAGFVYIIGNPIYPDHYKIGMTVDTEKRLQTYQTYDPFRKFYIVRYEFVLDRRQTESAILNSFNISLESGEWVKRNKVEKVFTKLASTYDKILAQ
jgi:hypothetical protein